MSMPFSVYTVVFETRSFVGIARYPETAIKLAVVDASREDPWTFLGKEIKALGEYTTDTVERPSFAGALAVKAAIVENQKKIFPGNDDYYDNLSPYSLVDDEYPVCTKNEANKEPYRGVLITPFTSKDASAEFQRLFLKDLPFDNIESTLPDFLGSVFARLCVRTLNNVSDAFVYNRKTRRVVIKTPDGREEIKMAEFLDRVIPWFVDSLTDALYIAIDDEHADAYEALRKLSVVVDQTDECFITIADVIKKSAPNFDALQKRGMTKEYATVRKLFDESLRDDRDMTRIHEKMRYLYQIGRAHV